MQTLLGKCSLGMIFTFTVPKHINHIVVVCHLFPATLSTEDVRMSI